MLISSKNTQKHPEWCWATYLSTMAPLIWHEINLHNLPHQFLTQYFLSKVSKHRWYGRNTTKAGFKPQILLLWTPVSFVNGNRIFTLRHSVKIRNHAHETPRPVPDKLWQLLSFQCEKRIHWTLYISVFLLMLFYLQVALDPFHFTLKLSSV